MPDKALRRLLCARHPHLSLVAALRRHPELRGEAVIVGGALELRLPVLAASTAAAAAGVCAGQPLRQAQQLCPQAAFVSIDDGDVERLRADVTTELGAPIADLFANFDREPLAAASVAQVHAATLRSGE